MKRRKCEAQRGWAGTGCNNEATMEVQLGGSGPWFDFCDDCNTYANAAVSKRRDLR
jgi:hypothetical protein